MEHANDDDDGDVCQHCIEVIDDLNSHVGSMLAYQIADLINGMSKTMVGPGYNEIDAELERVATALRTAEMAVGMLFMKLFPLGTYDERNLDQFHSSVKRNLSVIRADIAAAAAGMPETEGNA